MNKLSITFTAAFTALSALFSAAAVNTTAAADDATATETPIIVDLEPPAQTSAPRNRYTDDEGNIYRYSIINDGAAISIDGQSLIKSTDLVLPSYIDGLPVEVVNGAVIRNTNVTSITLPETCKKISGFFNNQTIETVTMNEGLEIIQTSCFDGCTNLKSVNIPSSVAIIYYNTFNECASLKHVKFNNGLITIDSCAFLNCDLESVSLPNTLETVGRNAFKLNKSLKELIIPSSVKTIYNGAFGQTGIKKLQLHNNIQTIEAGAFFGCDDLTEITGLTNAQIAKFWLAYNETPWAKSIVNEEEPFIIDDDNNLVAYVGSEDNIVIPDGVKVIGMNAFSGKDMKSVTIPSSVTKIERTAFYGCKNLESITIPASVNSIGQLAFSHCTNLKDITLEYSKGILSLGSGAFQFTAVTADTLITNKRKYTDQQNPFANTALDPEYAPDESPAPSASPDPEASPSPSASPSAQPSAAPETPGTLDVSLNGGNISISINGTPVVFPDEKPFIDSNDRTQVPVRAVAEALQCNVDWNAETQTVTITKDNDLIVLIIGSKTMQSGKEIITMDTEAQIVNDRTYIPVRFVGEALGMTVSWESE